MRAAAAATAAGGGGDPLAGQQRRATAQGGAERGGAWRTPRLTQWLIAHPSSLAPRWPLARVATRRREGGGGVGRRPISIPLWRGGGR